MCSSGEYCKYSTTRPLLEMMKEKRFKIVTRCLVNKIHQENNKAVFLDTDKGEVRLGGAKLILAMGPLPATTLMLNSFPPSSHEQLSGVGKRFTAHFISTITARIPCAGSNMFGTLSKQEGNKPEMAALYIAGKDRRSNHQFHIQLTAVYVRKGVNYDTMQNLLKTPKKEILASSEGYIVFICTSLGQLDHHNPENWFKIAEDNTTHTSSTDITCNTTLQVVANETDLKLWDVMDETTFHVLEEQLAPQGKSVEYWNSTEDNQGEWSSEHPSKRKIRSKGVVHPASTMWIGGDEESELSPVNLDYQFRGVENVYLTGGALWPTGASWNPTCTMTSLAMHLADKLTSGEQHNSTSS